MTLQVEPQPSCRTTDDLIERRKKSWWRVLRRSRHANAGGVFGSLIIVVFIVVSIFHGVLQPYNPTSPLARPFLRPDAQHWFGTDELGRDELSRVMAGTGIALISAFLSVGIALTLGTVLGVASGYRAKTKLDEGVSRLVDILFSFPEYVGAILVIAILGTGLWSACLAIGIIYSPRFARIVRTATVDVTNRAYIDAARLSGRKGRQIVVDHVLPNITSPVMVMIGLSLSNAAGTYAALSFLGFGVAPPAADYGSMLGAAEPYLRSDPLLVIFPAGALVLLIVAFNLLGDWIRDKLARRSGDLLQLAGGRTP